MDGGSLQEEGSASCRGRDCSQAFGCIVIDGKSAESSRRSGL
jgi:hypothetical protein